MNRMNPRVDFFFSEAETWQDEFEKLRTILLDCPLTEELKWGVPCYTLEKHTIVKNNSVKHNTEKHNIVLLHGFKEYCALLFFKGALLADPDGILVQQTEQVQAARQIRFTNVGEILAMESSLKAYLDAAIAIEAAGLKVEYKKTADLPMPEEFINQVEEVPGLQDAFDALTPGRQRAYLLHFSAPKQAKTREARIAKWIPQILAGKGLTD